MLVSSGHDEERHRLRWGCGVFESLLVIVACHYYCSFSYNCTVATYKYDKRVDNLVVHY